VARPERRPLHQRRADPEIGEHRGEVNDHQRGAHDAERLGAEQTGEGEKQSQAQDRLKSGVRKRPDHATERASPRSPSGLAAGAALGAP
jgi:hypothetical protein